MSPEKVSDTPTTTGDIETLITVLQGDLKTLPTNEAIPLIDQWEQMLLGSASNDLAPVAATLSDLRNLIADAGGDAAAIRDILGRLSEQVCALANDEPDTRLIRLSDALAQAAHSLEH